MDDFNFHTSLRGGTANVRCEWWYEGDLRIKIIGVEWGFSGDFEVDCTEDEKSVLLDRAYEWLEEDLKYREDQNEGII